MIIAYQIKVFNSYRAGTDYIDSKGIGSMGAVGAWAPISISSISPPILTCQCLTLLLQVFAIELITFAVDFILLAVEFGALAVEFVGFAVEIVTLAMELGAFALESALELVIARMTISRGLTQFVNHFRNLLKNLGILRRIL